MTTDPGAIDLVGLLAAIVETIDPTRGVLATTRALEELLVARLALEDARIFLVEPGAELRAEETLVRAAGAIRLPLRARGALRGVAVLGALAGSTAARLSDDALLAVGGCIAVALEQARLVDATRVRAEVDHALLDAARFAATTADLGAVLERHAEALARTARARRCAVALADERSERALAIRAVYAESAEARAELRELRPLRDSTLIERAWLSERLVAGDGEAFAALPLVAGGSVRGVALLSRETPLDAETRALLEAIGHEVALAIVAAEDREAARRATERAAVEAQVRSSVNESFDLDRILAGAVERLGRALGVNRCLVGLPDDDPRVTRMVHEWRLPADLPSALSWRFTQPDRPVVRAAAGAHPGPLVVTDVLLDPRLGTMESIAPGDYRSFVIAPFAAGALKQGGLLVGDMAPRRWSEEEIRLVGAIAEQCAIAVGRARLHDDARRRAEELEQVISQMTDGVLMCNERFEVIRVNEAARHILFGRIPSPLPVMADLQRTEVLDTDRRPLTMAETPLARALLHGETTHHRQLIIREAATRQEKWVECSGAPIQDGTGRRVGAIFVFRDVTEKRAAAENASRTEKLRVVGELAASVAHELNNTLAAVLGRAEFIQATTAEEETRRNADIIAAATQDATVVLGRLTRLSHKAPGVAPRSRVSLASVASDAIELTRPRWSRIPRVTVTLAAPRDPVLTYGTATELREVVTNLVLNAVDALSPGGSVRIVVEGAPGRARISVIDDGAGMTEDVLARAFEPFFTTKGEAGTGLGLNICSAIVTAHGGRIEARSAAGEGTTIHVTLPLAEDGETPRQPATVPPALRLLVVDDDPRVLSVLADALAREGHAIETAASGEAALEQFLAAREKPRVLVTDVSMPGMSGIHLAEEVVAREPGTAIVLVSGWAGSATTEALERLGAAMVTKPFATADVRTAIARALARRAEKRR